MIVGTSAGRIVSRSRVRAVRSPHDLSSPHEFARVLERERARADRNGHGFSLVTFDGGGRRRGFEGQLKQALRGRLRLTDQLGWFDGQRIGVLLFNTGREDAWDYANRVREAMTVGEHGPLCSVHTYPTWWPESEAEQARSATEELFWDQLAEVGASGHPCIAMETDADPLENVPLPVWKRALDLIVAVSLVLVSAPLLAVFSRRGAHWIS